MKSFKSLVIKHKTQKNGGSYTETTKNTLTGNSNFIEIFYSECCNIIIKRSYKIILKEIICITIYDM